MGIKEKGTRKKVPISINLEGWIWDTVDKTSENRTRFFRELFLEKMKSDLSQAKVIAEGTLIDEKFVEYYRIFCREKKHKPAARVGRTRVRGMNEEKHLAEHRKKKAVSINLESWIWQLIDDLEPNRSAYFRGLVLRKIKQELSEAGLIRGDAVMGKVHGDLYCRHFAKGKPNLQQGKLG